MDLPKQFDVLVLGTGLTESIVAAASSRAGKSVLHLDRNNFYGSQWTSLNFRQVDAWIEIESANDRSLFSNVERMESFTDTWSRDELVRLGNRINIDLCPRLIYSNGPMVELLVKSNISRYLEFINCHKLYFLKEESDGFKCVPVPSSRSNIFTSKDLTIVQKRRLTKFLVTYSQSDLSELTEISFKNLMDDQQLDKELQVIFKTVLAMKSDECSASEAVQSLKQFIASAGRYGDTPFLWTLAGSGELSQAFCRLSAVFGGTYCLESSPTELQFESDHTRFSFKGSEITAKFVVGSIDSVPVHLITVPTNLKKSSHVACLINKSLTGSDEGWTSFLRMEGGSEGINVTELGDSSWCVPKGLYLVHLSCLSMSETSKQDFLPIIEKLFSTVQDSSGRPQLIWSLFYNISFVDNSVRSNSDNLFVVDGPVFEMDYGKCISEAKSIFEKMFPNEEFLPKAPDAEDIVIEVENGTVE